MAKGTSFFVFLSLLLLVFVVRRVNTEDQSWADWTMDKFSGGHGNEVKDKVGEMAGQAKDKMEDVASGAMDMAGKAKAGGGEAMGSAEKAFEDVKRKMSDSYEAATKTVTGNHGE